MLSGEDLEKVEADGHRTFANLEDLGNAVGDYLPTVDDAIDTTLDHEYDTSDMLLGSADNTVTFIDEDGIKLIGYVRFEPLFDYSIDWNGSPFPKFELNIGADFEAGLGLAITSKPASTPSAFRPGENQHDSPGEPGTLGLGRLFRSIATYDLDVTVEVESTEAGNGDDDIWFVVGAKGNLEFGPRYDGTWSFPVKAELTPKAQVLNNGDIMKSISIGLKLSASARIWSDLFYGKIEFGPHLELHLPHANEPPGASMTYRGEYDVNLRGVAHYSDEIVIPGPFTGLDDDTHSNCNDEICLNTAIESLH